MSLTPGLKSKTVIMNLVEDNRTDGNHGKNHIHELKSHTNIYKYNIFRIYNALYNKLKI